MKTDLPSTWRNRGYWKIAFAALLFVFETSPALPAPVFSKPVEIPCLTTVNQVRNLPASEAERNFPVRITGVVMHYDSETFHDLVIQDQTAGIYVIGTAENKTRLRRGQLVEICGVSSAGEYSPIVADPRIRVLGEAPIPPARPVSFEQLASGSEDGQWVEIGGVVRSAIVANPQYSDRLMVKLATPNGELTFRVLNFDPTATNWLVDAEVRVRGVCISIFNRRRQLLDVSLMVPEMSDILVERATPEQPFSKAARPVNTLLQFTPSSQERHRVKVRGQVTWEKPGECIFIKDDTQGLCVRTSQQSPLQLGDVVEVLGFPARGEYSPTLEDAVFRRVASGPQAEPVRVKVDQMFLEDHDADLIQIEARLLQQIRHGSEVVLMLEEGRRVFSALLSSPSGNDLNDFPPSGSRIQVTGICQVEMQNRRWPQSFRLLLRSPADIQVIQPPPWWTLKRMFWVLGLASLLFLAVLGVVMWHSRGKVREQIFARREAEAQFAAVNRERNRLGAELHDSLEQGLIGVALQLEVAQKALVTDSNRAKRHLEQAKSMVRESQREVRRSVWDLRSQMLENNDLPSALTAIAKQLSASSEVRITVGTTGHLCRLDETVEGNLLRIAQEAMANALKHSRAKNLNVYLHYRDDAVRLDVRDDGQGFVPETNGRSVPGHFGLCGMRERAKRLGGKLNFESTPGIGTNVEITVPLASAAKTP